MQRYDEFYEILEFFKKCFLIKTRKHPFNLNVVNFVEPFVYKMDIERTC